MILNQEGFHVRFFNVILLVQKHPRVELQLMKQNNCRWIAYKIFKACLVGDVTIR